MKFLHAADLHLDSPLRGLERYDGAPVDRLRGASRRAMENLVDLCLAEEVDFVVIAGDLYDGDWRDYSTGLFFAAQLSRLRAADIRVYWLRGNHDAASRITRHLRLPETSFELSTRAAQTYVLEDLGVAIHGQGFATRAVSDDLAAHYPAPVAGLFNIGVLHTSVNGRPGHEPYAPCRLETLVEAGYDYWALGHVHAREVLHERPWIVFPGNLQGRHIREVGAKGATLVEVVGGRVAAATHHALDVVRWQRLEVDASDCASPDDVVDAARREFEEASEAADGRLLALRVNVTGRTGAHVALHADAARWLSALRASATDVDPDSIWLEKIALATEAVIDETALRQRDDAIGQLMSSLRDLRSDDERIAAMAASLEEVRAKLPAEVRSGAEDILGTEAVREALDDVERILFARLLSQGEPT